VRQVYLSSCRKSVPAATQTCRRLAGRGPVVVDPIRRDDDVELATGIYIWTACPDTSPSPSTASKGVPGTLPVGIGSRHTEAGPEYKKPYDELTEYLERVGTTRSDRR